MMVFFTVDANNNKVVCKIVYCPKSGISAALTLVSLLGIKHKIFQLLLDRFLSLTITQLVYY